MNYFITLINLAFFFICFQLQAQQVFTKLYTYGGIYTNDNLNNKSIIAAPDNGCLIVGETNDSGILIRMDSLGNVLWNKTLNPPIEISDIVAARDTFYYLIGKRLDTLTNYVNLIKFNFHGGIIWSRKIEYTSYQNLQPLSIQATSDSGLVFCGNTSDSIQKSFVTKIDKNGNINWSNVIQLDNLSTIFSSISQTPDSGFVMIGSINQTKGSIVKLNKAGNISWCKTYIDMSGKDILVHHNKLFAYFSLYSPLFVILDLSGNIISAKGYDIVSYNGFFSSSNLN